MRTKHKLSIAGLLFPSIALSQWMRPPPSEKPISETFTPAHGQPIRCARQPKKEIVVLGNSSRHFILRTTMLACSLAPALLLAVLNVATARAADSTTPALTATPADLLAHIAPVADAPKTFRVSQIAQPRDVTLVPFYRVNQQRYVAYWKLASSQSPAVQEDLAQPGAGEATNLDTASAKAADPFGQALIPDMLADPSIVDMDGTFYCYATTDGWGRGLASSGTPVVWKSKDFLNWSFSGSIFPGNFEAKYWAPSGLIYKSNRYYLFPTLDGKITAVVADSPEGPFRALDGREIAKGSGWRPFPVRVGKPIDADILMDDDGAAYMVWAQRGIGKLKPDFSGFDSEQTLIATKRTGYSEGPILFKRKGIYYYLYTLGGRENYQYAYMMSRTSPLGPWEAPADDIISTTDHQAGVFGPGHGCVVHPQGSGQWVFVYLEFGRGGTNRQIFADKMNFNEDGTIQPVKLTKEGVGALRPAADRSSNLALGKLATASSARPDVKIKPQADKSLDRTDTCTPANAVDGSNGTRWLAAENDPNAWWQIDLGAPVEIHRTEAYFVKPAAGHAYKLESSLDEKTWLSYGGHEDVILQSPHTDTKTAIVRYLRLKVLKGTPGLWEFRVY